MYNIYASTYSRVSHKYSHNPPHHHPIPNNVINYKFVPKISSIKSKLRQNCWCAQKIEIDSYSHHGKWCETLLCFANDAGTDSNNERMDEQNRWAQHPPPAHIHSQIIIGADGGFIADFFGTFVQRTAIVSLFDCMSMRRVPITNIK